MHEIDVKVVVLAAGPFLYTSKQFVDACLRTKTHYLDITGEAPVFEAVLARHSDAVAAGVALLAGIGLDVVPTDCLSAKLHEALPSATNLQLALLPSEAALSPGTTKTILLSLSEPTKVRRDRELAHSRRSTTDLLAWNHPTLGRVLSMPFTWGDIVTAYHTTQIPNIEIFMKSDGGLQASIMAGWTGAAINYITGFRVTRWVAGKFVEMFVKGPSAKINEEGRFLFQGIAWDAATKRAVECTLSTPEGYKLTALSMVAATHKLLSGTSQIAGALTPSQAFGIDYITEFPNSSWGDLVQRDLSDEEIAHRTR